MPSIELTDAEWILMDVVWDHDEVRVRDVLSAVQAQQGWAYSTVKTMLDRLVEKGILTQSMQGITRFYQARVSREQAQQQAARGLAQRAFKGKPSGMLHFLIESESLTAKERRELAAMLERRKSK